MYFYNDYDIKNINLRNNTCREEINVLFGILDKANPCDNRGFKIAPFVWWARLSRYVSKNLK